MEISAKNLRVMDQMPPFAPRYYRHLLFKDLTDIKNLKWFIPALTLGLNETSTVAKLVLILITGSSGCVYPPLMEIFEWSDVRLSGLLDSVR